MTFLDRFAARRRERRRRKAAASRRDITLREFVYLDDVSVYSLIASRLGPVATEFTATESSTLASEIQAAAGFAAGIKAETESRLESSRTTGSQVVRKSIVQTTFRELLEYERETLVVGAPTGERQPVIRNRSELQAAFTNSNTGQWIIAPSSLKRGELLEISVELEAEPIFRVSAALAAVLGVVEGSPELIDSANDAELGEAFAAKRALDELLAGLVPLRGRATDFVHVTIGDESRLVDRAILEALPDSASLDVRPLFVVGVAQADLFWKDIRRVVFSGSRYQVLCRVARDGIHANWSPVKLVDVLQSIAPELARQIDDAGEGLLAAMARR